MDDRQFMERTGCRHIQKLYIPVFCRIMFRGRMVEQYPVEFKAFSVLNREYHDPLGKAGGLRIAVSQRQFLSQARTHHRRLFFIPADDSNGLPPLFHPAPDVLFCLGEHFVFIFTLCHRHLISMTADGFHRINRKISMTENLRRKVGNLHRIPVAFFQKTESAGIRGEHQFSQILPVV